MIKYILNKATETDICNHLSTCDANFVKDLIERVDVAEYSKKIYNKSVRFEAWADNMLVGLVAAYCNDQIIRKAYITSVSVLGLWQGKGIAMQLIGRCIKHVESLGMHSISLEVARENMSAIWLYEKHGFVVAETGDSFITMNLFFEKGQYNDM